MSDMQQPVRVPARHAPAFVLLGILLLTVIAYSNSFAGVWQFDDFPVIVNDARVQSLSAWWQAMPAIRPLFKLSVAIDHARSTPTALTAFHFSNLLFHLINVCLVFALLRRLLRALPLPDDHEPLPSGEGRPIPPRAALWLSTLATLCFALHPAQTEAVTYLSGRSVALATLFMLASLLLMPKNRPADPVTEKFFSKMLNWLPATLALIAAVAVRETAVITPLLMGLLWQAERGQSAVPSWRVSMRLLIRLTLLALLLILILLLVFPLYQHLISFAFGRADLASHLAAQSQSLAGLLLTAAGIAPLNADPDLIIAPLLSLQSLLALLLLLAVVLLVWRLSRRYRLAGWAGLALVIICLPSHSLLLRLDALNDRQLYPLLPWLAVLAGLLLWSCWPRLKKTGTAALPIAVALPLLLALMWATQTWQRNRVYSSELAFWQDVHEKSPHNARACNNLGVARADAGDQQGAVVAFRCALANDPQYVQAAINLRLLQEHAWPSRSR